MMALIDVGVSVLGFILVAAGYIFGVFAFFAMTIGPVIAMLLFGFSAPINPDDEESIICTGDNMGFIYMAFFPVGAFILSIILPFCWPVSFLYGFLGYGIFENLSLNTQTGVWVGVFYFCSWIPVTVFIEGARVCYAENDFPSFLIQTVVAAVVMVFINTVIGKLIYVAIMEELA